MGVSPTHNSSGKMYGGDKKMSFGEHFYMFFSPVRYWSIYGYWISLLGLVLFRDQAGIVDSALKLPEKVTSIRPELYENVTFEFFVLIPSFFAISIFIIFVSIAKGNLRKVTHLSIHIVLILFFSLKIFEYLSLAFAYVW